MLDVSVIYMQCCKILSARKDDAIYIYTVKKNGASLLLLDHKHRLGE